MKKSKKQKEVSVRVPRLGDLHNVVFGYNNTVLTTIISIDEDRSMFTARPITGMCKNAPFEDLVIPFSKFNYAGRSNPFMII